MSGNYRYNTFILAWAVETLHRKCPEESLVGVATKDDWNSPSPPLPVAHYLVSSLTQVDPSLFTTTSNSVLSTV